MFLDPRDGWLAFVIHPWHNVVVLRSIRQAWHEFRTNPPTTDEFRYWTDWANRLSTSAFFIWLAGYVADDLLRHKGHSVTTEQLLDSVADDSSSMVQYDAEQFLQRRYISYPFNQRTAPKMMRIFRHLVQRQIRRRSSLC